MTQSRLVYTRISDFVSNIKEFLGIFLSLDHFQKGEGIIFLIIKIILVRQGYFKRLKVKLKDSNYLKKYYTF